MCRNADIGWDEEKNRKLKAERGLAFEDVIAAIENGWVLDDLRHSGTKRAHQRILVVDIGGYACGVPYVIDGDVLFLKIIYRSRDFQRAYMRAK